MARPLSHPNPNWTGSKSASRGSSRRPRTLIHYPAVTSESRGPDIPLLNLTISEALRRAAARFPDRDALIVRHQNQRLTWSRFDREATRTAAGLSALGLRP